MSTPGAPSRPQTLPLLIPDLPGCPNARQRGLQAPLSRYGRPALRSAADRHGHGPVCCADSPSSLLDRPTNPRTGAASASARRKLRCRRSVVSVTVAAFCEPAFSQASARASARPRQPGPAGGACPLHDPQELAALIWEASAVLVAPPGPSQFPMSKPQQVRSAPSACLARPASGWPVYDAYGGNACAIHDSMPPSWRSRGPKRSFPGRCGSMKRCRNGQRTISAVEEARHRPWAKVTWPRQDHRHDEGAFDSDSRQALGPNQRRPSTDRDGPPGGAAARQWVAQLGEPGHFEPRPLDRRMPKDRAIENPDARWATRLFRAPMCCRRVQYPITCCALSCAASRPWPTALKAWPRWIGPARGGLSQRLPAFPGCQVVQERLIIPDHWIIYAR